ncbi:MAG: pirin family protein [Phycisphaerales bacterium JB063]
MNTPLNKTAVPSFTVVRADERGRTRLGWLDSAHSFSFGRYIDRGRMGFRALRVINDDVVAPGGGFGEHPHADMEIMTWMLSGSLRHGDSLDNSEVLVPGELQRMTAGSGIRHSEFNASSTEPAHLLQVWIESSERGLPPAYGQRPFPAEGRRGRWQTLATGRPGDLDGEAFSIAQDASMRVADVDASSSLPLSVEPGRYAYVHVATGSATLDGVALEAGDAAQVAGPAELTLAGAPGAQVLAFDLA